MRIIAALDILDGRCVRLTRGDFSSGKVYNEDPLEAARAIEDSGIRFLHVVDLDGAKKQKIINYGILEKIASATSLNIDFSGGLRSEKDLSIAFSCGAGQVVAGSVAVESPAVFMQWLSRFGSDKVILGADSVNRNIAVRGWQLQSDKDVMLFIRKYHEAGVKYAVCTDIGRDGTLSGPATELYREIIADSKINLIASGGISSLNDVEDVREAGCEAVIIGKAIYEGKIKLKDLGNLC